MGDVGKQERTTARRALSGVTAVLVAAALLGGAAGCSDGDDEPERRSPEAAEPARSPFRYADYSHLERREFAKIAKNPLVNEGRRIIVFGRVDQFDPTTGPAFFLAYLGFDRRTAEASYDVFAALAGDEDMLFDVVQHDVFKAYVTVLGTYEGSRVLPKFQVDRIEVIKSA